MKSLGLLGLVFDTGLTVTPLLGHLGCLASHALGTFYIDFIAYMSSLSKFTLIIVIDLFSHLTQLHSSQDGRSECAMSNS